MRRLDAAVAMIWSASATVRQSGFSQATCLPARSKVRVSATWCAGGVATSATSTSSSLTSSLTDAYVRTPGKSVSAAFRRSTFGSTTATSSSPSVAVTPSPW